MPAGIVRKRILEGDMMKKAVLGLALVFGAAAGASLWAQTANITSPAPGFTGKDFSAFKVQSTEKHFSGGLFSSDIDNYLDVNSYNPEIGTFVFAAGGTGFGKLVGAGFAQSFGFGYLDCTTAETSGNHTHIAGVIVMVMKHAHRLQCGTTILCCFLEQRAE
jgi:hypothetical protein